MTPTTMSTMKKTHLSSEKSLEKKPAPGMLLRDGGFCEQPPRQTRQFLILAISPR